MSYTLLRQDILADSWQAHANDDLDIIALSSGKANNITAPVQVEIENGDGSPTDFFENPYFIVSAAMRKALESFGIADVQYYAVTLVDEAGKTISSDYWLGNITNIISCVDVAKSSYESLGGRKKVLRGFAVDESKVSEQALFRLEENSRLVIVSDKLKDHLVKAGLKGLFFQETKDFDGKPASSFWK